MWFFGGLLKENASESYLVLKFHGGHDKKLEKLMNNYKLKDLRYYSSNIYAKERPNTIRTSIAEH